jgi:hypothetical protein
VRREVLYRIFIELGVPMKLVRFIKMLIIGVCILLRVILIVNNNTFCFATIVAKQKVLLFTIIKMCLNETYSKVLLAYADDVNLLGDNIDTTKKNTETLIVPVRRLV